jgi:hypothetical protein
MKFKISRLLKAILLSTVIVTTSVATTCITQTAYAEDEITSIPEGGVIGESTKFKGTLSEDGTLRISKIGSDNTIELCSFLNGSSGLGQYGKSIKKLIIEEGIVTLKGSGSIDLFSKIAPNIEQIVLPNSCTTISEYVFYKLTKLQSIKLGNNTTEIQPNAFSYCNSLKNIKLQPTMKLGGNAFLYNSFKTVDLPDGIKIGGDYPIRHCSALENIIVEGDYSGTGTISYPIFDLVSGVYLKKIVYLKSTWDTKLIYEPDKHINTNTTIYCTEENYESVYEALSSTKAKFVKISDLGDMASETDISDDNVTLEDILYDIEEVTDGDELEVPIEGSTNMATVRITVPTEVGFVIAPNTKSKFITKPFKIVNQTGAPIVFTLNELKPTSASNALKVVKRTYKNRTAEDWSRLSPEETEEGIALNCTFDVTGGNNFTSTTDRIWVDPDTSAGDITELKLSFDADAEITGKLGGLYGLAWDDEYTGSYALKGTVKLGYTDEDPSTPGDPITP